MEVGFFCFGVGVVLQGFQILGLDKKQKVNYKRFCPEPKFETLAGQFYLLRVLESVQYSDFSVQLFQRWEAPSKDNANTTALNTQLIKTIDEFPTK